MTEESKTVDINTDDLDDFNDLFNGSASEQAPEDDRSEEENVEEENQDTDSDDDEDTSKDDEDTEDDADNDTAEDSSATDDEDEEEEETPAPKKKNSAQERINELTAARREAEREVERLKAELASQKTTEKKDDNSDPGNTGNESEEAKRPDASDRDKYPLGDLDPQYQEDMLEFRLDQRISELDAKRDEQSKQRAEEARQAALQNEWNAKLSAAEETHENFRETVQSLESAFEGVDPQHGQFIAETIMQMENGPDVLYHLGNNPGLVADLVGANPVNAALALGRIEASLGRTEEAPKKASPKQSKAPKPPASVNKGNAPRFSVRPDTDDLDAFEDAFFKD